MKNLKTTLIIDDRKKEIIENNVFTEERAIELGKASTLTLGNGRCSREKNSYFGFERQRVEI